MQISRITKIIIGVLLILAIGVKVWLFFQSRQVTISTDKTEYLKREGVRITIKNHLRENICFSSCYPYYLSKKNGSWESYYYEECQKKDIIEKCIGPGDSKTFETALSWAKTGLHQFAVPACIRCKVGNEFKESRRFYSNEFLIK